MCRANEDLALPVLSGLQLRRHVVEGAGYLGDLVVAVDRGTKREIASGDRAGCILEGGKTTVQLVQLLRNFNAGAPAFRDDGDRIDPATDQGSAL